jgi:hypothetical protein
MMRDRMTAHITAWHCARNVEALLPAYTEFGIPADVQLFLGGYVLAVSGWKFGRCGGWTFLDFFFLP